MCACVRASARDDLAALGLREALRASIRFGACVVERQLPVGRVEVAVEVYP